MGLMFDEQTARAELPARHLAHRPVADLWLSGDSEHLENRSWQTLSGHVRVSIVLASRCSIPSATCCP